MKKCCIVPPGNASQSPLLHKRVADRWAAAMGQRGSNTARQQYRKAPVMDARNSCKSPATLPERTL